MKKTKLIKSKEFASRSSIVGLMVLGASPVWAAAPIPIPGTDTTVQFKGFVQIEAFKELDNTFGGQTFSNFTPFSKTFGGIPYDGTVQAERDGGQSEMGARNSRLGIGFNTPTDYGDLKFYFETDLHGTGGSKYQSNSHAFRLRHAYFSINGWLGGQTWSNSADIGQGVTLLDILGGPVGIPAIGRFPQIRYTHGIGDGGNLSVALQQAVQDWNGADPVTFGTPNTVYSANAVDEHPDIAIRYTLAKSWGRQSIGTVFRRLTSEGTSGSLTAPGEPEIDSSSEMGYMVNYQGQVNVLEKDKLLYSAVYVDGAGRYINHPQTSGYLNADNELETVEGFGWNLGYQRHWNPEWQTAVTYGQTSFDADDWGRVAGRFGRFENTAGLHMNLLWKPIPNALIGVEYMYGEVENDVGDDGNAQRLTAAARFSF